jgi:TolB-like protein/Flp pilus assembly protein TadD
MFTDMVGYSALTQRNESLALELLQEHRQLLRDLFPQFSGREVETTGDGFLVEFGSALEAAKCAIEIQRAIASRNLTVPPERQIQLRIGIHVGDVVHRDGHVLGDGVNIAARLQPLAEPGGICISVDVARQVQNNLQATVVKVGEAELKNIRLPMEICRIVLPWEKGHTFNDTATSGGRVQVTAPGNSLKTKVILAIGALVFLNLLVAVVFLQQRPEKKAVNQTMPRPAAQTGPQQKSVAILPFVNMSADKADEYLSDGMTEELLNALTKVKGLRVPGRSSCFAFKGKNERDIFRQVGEQLQVSAVLEGSVRKAGNQLRITAQLINAADGFHLWSETYDREMTNIFAIQSDIAQRVASALQVQLGVEETAVLSKKPTANLEAYNLYLQGRQFYAKYSEEGIYSAIDYLKRAVQLDPSFAQAYTILAGAYISSTYHHTPPNEAIPLARAAGRRALVLDDTLADSHAGMALVELWDWQWDQAAAEVQRALSINRNCTDAHDIYGIYLLAIGRPEDAIREIQRALELDPISSFANGDLGLALMYARQYERALATCQHALKLDPGNTLAADHLWRIHSYRGEVDRALAVLDQEVDMTPEEKQSSTELAQIYTRAGKRDEAFQIVHRLEEKSKHTYVNLADVAVAYSVLGDLDQAFKWLDAAYEQRAPFPWDLLLAPDWDNIRGDPRYTNLLKRVGLKK